MGGNTARKPLCPALPVMAARRGGRLRGAGAARLAGHACAGRGVTLRCVAADQRACRRIVDRHGVDRAVGQILLDRYQRDGRRPVVGAAQAAGQRGHIERGARSNRQHHACALNTHRLHAFRERVARIHRRGDIVALALIDSIVIA